MPKLTAYFNRRVVAEHKFEEGPIRMGRHPDSEIFLAHKSVSRVHASLIMHKGYWVVVDSGGRNGVFMNGQQKKSFLLKHGSTFQIGKYTIRLVTEAEDPESGDLNNLLSSMMGGPPKKRAPKTVAKDEPAVSLVAPTGHEQVESTRFLDPAQILREKEVGHAMSAAHLSYKDLDGVPQLKELEDVTIIGKGSDAHIEIAGGLRIGKEHARIVKKRNRFSVESCGWLYAIDINGETLKGERILADNDVITIGDTTFRFHPALF